MGGFSKTSKSMNVVKVRVWQKVATRKNYLKNKSMERVMLCTKVRKMLQCFS